MRVRSRCGARKMSPIPTKELLESEDLMASSRFYKIEKKIVQPKYQEIQISNLSLPKIIKIQNTKREEEFCEAVKPIKLLLK